jgi:galactose mutarotase-like enzyme
VQEIILSNDIIEIKINDHGAELRSIKNLQTGKHYLWNADPKFWNRSSPVLFPFVGAVKDKVYRHEGVEYPMNQHGFARDMDFELVYKTENEVWFSVTSTDDAYKVYPFHFILEIGYRLVENAVVVMWKVKNTNHSKMYFSIGAHPAFFCPFHEGDKQFDYYLSFGRKDDIVPQKLTARIFGQGGCATNKNAEYTLDNGILQITEERFDNDALIIENSQVQRIALLDSEKREYLAVEFDAPLVGVWSPPKKNAPFVCIEPWYGRCDCEDFSGELKEREWGNVLEANEEFHAEYKIVV